MVGRVISTKMKNTVTVLVTGSIAHPLYKKTYTQSKKYLVHDLLGVKMGDIVEIVKVRPISKNKHWSISKVVGRDIKEMVSEELKEAAAEIIGEVMLEEESSDMNQELSKKTNSKKEIVVDNSTQKSQSKRKGKTELSKKK